jgi:hypothetical protein
MEVSVAALSLWFLCGIWVLLAFANALRDGLYVQKVVAACALVAGVLLVSFGSYRIGAVFALIGFFGAIILYEVVEMVHGNQ